MIIRLFCIFAAIACCLFIFGANNLHAEEVLILKNYGAMYSNEILIVRVSSGVPISKELARNMSDFRITESGHFLMKDKRSEPDSDNWTGR